MTLHNHLDSQRRQEGDCPKCDEEWEAQRARLGQKSRQDQAEREVTRLSEREGKLGAERYGKKL